MGYELITAPAVEPITLAEARAHLRATATDEDALIQAWIIAARRRAESITWRALCTQTWDWFLDAFPCSGEALEVPFPPLQSVTSISYVDDAGATQVLATSEYQVDSKAQPGRIAEAYSKTWPSTRVQMNAVTVRFVAGYGLADKVPWEIRAAMLLMVGHFYEHREDVSVGNIVNVMPRSADDLLAPYRIVRF